MQVATVRRYPVKAMGGEDMRAVEVTDRGLRGDRFYAVHLAAGGIASGKNSTRFRWHDEVFDYRAHTTEHGIEVARDLSPGSATEGRTRLDETPVVSWLVGDPGLNEALTSHLGVEVALRPEQGMSHYDVSPVSLIGTASLQWCRDEYGVDARARRLRANLVVETQEPWIEDTWVPMGEDDPGAVIRIGAVSFRARQRITRCRMIDLAQDGLSTTTPWLKALRDRNATAGIYLDPIDEGTLSVGDAVEVIAA